VTLFQFCNSGHKTKTEKHHDWQGLFKFYQDEWTKERLSEIVRTDSILENENRLKIFKSFDIVDSLILEMKYNTFQSDTRKPYLTRNLFNEKGKVIVYELYNMEGKRLEGFKYLYSEKGQMTGTYNLTESE
jgi:hypothetical protein